MFRHVAPGYLVPLLHMDYVAHWVASMPPKRSSALRWTGLSTVMWKVAQSAVHILGAQKSLGETGKLGGNHFHAGVFGTANKNLHGQVKSSWKRWARSATGLLAIRLIHLGRETYPSDWSWWRTCWTIEAVAYMLICLAVVVLLDIADDSSAGPEVG